MRQFEDCDLDDFEEDELVDEFMTETEKKRLREMERREKLAHRGKSNRDRAKKEERYAIP